MKKIKCFLSQNLFEAANLPLREKSDVINLLLLTVPEVLINESVDRKIGYCEVIIDKMSRIVYTLQKDGIIYKQFSFAFPYYLKENLEEGLLKWIISDNNGEYLNSQMINVLLNLANEGLFADNLNIEIEPLEFYDRILHAIKEEDAIDFITDVQVWHFIRKLFLFEPGYIRYDFDDNVKRCNEITHPLHHLDFYFSSNATFKIGVAKDNHDFSKWMDNSFENLLNVKAPCYYLKL